MVVQEYISLGHERLLSPKEAAFQPEGISWWLPHYAVVNPNKPNKVRVVFDTAAKHAGTSLIDALLKGTDFLTSLVVVLTRFRLFKVAINADILKMFHSDRVPLSDASAFRFLWRRPGSSKPAKEYQMQVQIFSAMSSPSVCAYALWKAATDGGSDTTFAMTQIIYNFYVYKWLSSFHTVEEEVDAADVMSRVLK